MVMLLFSYWYVSNRIDQAGSEAQVFNMAVSPGKLEINGLDNIRAYDAIVERPLFIEEREIKKTLKKRTTRIVKPAVKKLKLKALGVAVTNETVLAVVKNLSTGKITRLNVGDLIDGWTLESVAEHSFVFSKDNQQKIVRFKN